MEENNKMTRNFRKIWMNLGEEDNLTPDWTYDEEKAEYVKCLRHNGGFGAIRYIPKDAKIDGI